MIDKIYDRHGQIWQRYKKGLLQKNTNKFFNQEEDTVLDVYRLDGSYGPLKTTENQHILPHQLLV